MTELEAGAEDTDPSLSPDGLALYFTSDRGGEVTLWTTTRASVSGPFAPPGRVAELDEPGVAESDPWITADGSTLLFTRGDPDLADRRLFMATRP